MNRWINIMYTIFVILSCSPTDSGEKDLPWEDKDVLRVPYVEYHGPEFWKNDPDILREANLNYDQSKMKPLMYAFLVPSTEASKVMSNPSNYGFYWFNQWTDTLAQPSAIDSTPGRIDKVLFPRKNTYPNFSFIFEDKVFIVFKDILSPLRYYFSKDNIPLLNEDFNYNNFYDIEFIFHLGSDITSVSEQWNYDHYINSYHNEFIAPRINPNLRLEIGDSFHILFVAVLFNKNYYKMSYFRPINLNSLTNITYIVNS